MEGCLNITNIAPLGYKLNIYFSANTVRPNINHLVISC